MGHDTVSIVSMNSARQGLFSLDRQARGSYMNRLLNELQPDIGALPGDNSELKKGVVVGYEQYMSMDNQHTMLLYDHKKVSMRKQNISDSIFNDLDKLDSCKFVWPEVQISSLEPYKQVVKTFSMISLHHELFSATDEAGNEMLMRMLARFAQRLALITRNPILIAGEMRLSIRAVRTILNAVNTETNQRYLQDANAFLREFTQVEYTSSMLRGSTRVEREVFKLETVACKRLEPVVKEWQPQADCFIASKALDMTEAKGIAVEKVLGQQVKMTALKNSCVTQSHMQLPVRPPRHHGG